MLLAECWRYRRLLAIPTLVLLLGALGLSLSQPVVFEAHTVLQLDTTKARSPLLQDITEDGHAETLLGILTSPNLLADTARDTGMGVDPSRIGLDVVSPRLIKITYTAKRAGGVEQLLDTLAYNFIYELLAPERLRIEQRLATTNEQLTAITARIAALQVYDPSATTAPAARDMEIQKLEAQQKLLQEAYTGMNADLSSVNAAFDKGAPHAVLWFAEPATLTPPEEPLLRHIHWALGGAALGLLLGLLLVMRRIVLPLSVISGDDLARLTGLPVLGDVPDLGDLRVMQGKMEVSVGQKVLNPADFAEVSRLHRLLTRHLHGVLLLTSSEAGEGTSTLAMLLAQRSVESGKATLLVDLNLKNGAITQAMGLAPLAWKLGERKGKDQMKDVIDEVGKLHVLPLPHDRETLEKLSQPGVAQAMFDRLTSAYEHIIVDTSPINALNRQNADPLMLAVAAARSVLVVMMNRTASARIKHSADLLLASGCNLTGTLANNHRNPSRKALLIQFAAATRVLSPSFSSWIMGKAVRLPAE